MLVTMLLSAPLRRRAVRGVAAAAAGALLFGAGAWAARLDPDSRPARRPTPAATTRSVRAAATDGQLDAVRDRIAASAVGKVDKDTLDQAAVQGMLGALHDKWANYLTPGSTPASSRASTASSAASASGCARTAAA